MAYLPPSFPSQTQPPQPPTLSKPAIEGLLSVLAKLTRKGLYYHRKTIHLDGLTFIECSFENCHFITANGTFTLTNCRIHGNETIFEYQGTAAKIARLHELMNASVNGKIVFPSLYPQVDQDGRVTV